MGAVAQFALPSGTELPQDSSLAPRRPRTPLAAMVPDYPAILRAPIFAPDRAPGEAPVLAAGPAGVSASAPIQLLGVAASGRAASAIVRGADGTTRVLAPGESAQGWRLISVEPNAATFLGPAGRVHVPVGGSSAPPLPLGAGVKPSPSSASEPQP